MSFSCLPPEIRIEIYNQILHSPALPSSRPEIDQQQRRRLGTDCFNGGGIWTLPSINPILSILLVNKTAYFEVQKALELFRHNPSYHVDIMFLKTYGLWPTWLIPALPQTQYVDNVYAHFRVFHPVNLDERFSGSLDFRCGDAGPPTAVWSFYRLLTGLLVNGPGSRHDYISAPPQSCQYIVRNIFINVDTSNSPVTEAHNSWPPETWLPRNRGLRPDSHEQDNPKPVERRLADDLEKEISSILELGYYTMDYGLIVYESVLENIVLLVDNKESKRWNIDKLVHEYEVAYWEKFRRA